MAIKKNFKYKVDAYYISIKTGGSNIVFSRDTEDEAKYVFENYKQVGKDCSWLGRWNGKSFEE